jgi:hypothetical protein
MSEWSAREDPSMGPFIPDEDLPIYCNMLPIRKA